MKLIDKWAPSQKPYALKWNTLQEVKFGPKLWKARVEAVRAGRKNGQDTLSYGYVSAWPSPKDAEQEGVWWQNWDNRYGLTVDYKYDGRDIWYDTSVWSFASIAEKLQTVDADWQGLPAVPTGYTGWYYAK